MSDEKPGKPPLSAVLSALGGEAPEDIERDPQVALRALGRVFGEAAGLLRDAAVGSDDDVAARKARLQQVEAELAAKGVTTEGTLGEAPETVRKALRDPEWLGALRDGVEQMAQKVTRGGADPAAGFADFLRAGAESLRKAADAMQPEAGAAAEGPVDPAPGDVGAPDDADEGSK